MRELESIMCQTVFVQQDRRERERDQNAAGGIVQSRCLLLLAEIREVFKRTICKVGKAEDGAHFEEREGSTPPARLDGILGIHGHEAIIAEAHCGLGSLNYSGFAL